ncbi:DUF3168 domain-containing protein [Croceicoccus naphthovorans]|uniref:Uncharacterized protein n=1 Tax=Croceicoccus naphthovorans TaxID=1348774 RepID=A0A0G3XF67_9SPHN|nr:DUF3168 domain-containing protein [Croceicoccus naphthovorans]AKM09286.1 hypothetical protein AB433_03705 [Croceicoccus naphthovorans]MBB3990184.1 hypothetical protein [Croceicoccus naphthovorans]
MEIALRAALLGYLSNHPRLSTELNAISEEAPLRASLPWLAIVASASSDWSHKTGSGREVRIAIELQARGDDPETAGQLVAEIEKAVEDLPHDQTGFRIANIQFLRARTEQRGGTIRAVLLEYRFRILAN